jgi:hypothetical protein
MTSRRIHNKLRQWNNSSKKNNLTPLSKAHIKSPSNAIKIKSIMRRRSSKAQMAQKDRTWTNKSQKNSSNKVYTEVKNLRRI